MLSIPPPGEGMSYPCEAHCGRPLDHEDPTVVLAYHQIHFSDGAPSIDGTAALFHSGCYSGDSRNLKRRYRYEPTD